MSGQALEARYQTLRVRVAEGRRTVVFDRVDRKNSFDAKVIEELDRALDDAERDASCRMLVLEGQGGYFSTGLDFEAGLSGGAPDGSGPYMHVLRRISALPAVVVASIDGQVRAGGLGFVAASDIAIATPRSTFSLPEALWGLVPACVGLHLSRRVGAHRAKRMCLTTETLTAASALQIGLLDEVSEDAEDAQRRLWLKIARLDRGTIDRIKRYFGDIAGVAPAHEARAMQETDRAMADPAVTAAIQAFVHHGTFPWEHRPGPPRSR